MNHEPEWVGPLRCGDFPSDGPVILSFDDGSICSFQYAFFRKEGEHTMVVYTEHCGYHSFTWGYPVPVAGTDYSQYKTVEDLRAEKTGS